MTFHRIEELKDTIQKASLVASRQLVEARKIGDHDACIASKSEHDAYESVLAIIDELESE